MEGFSFKKIGKSIGNAFKSKPVGGLCLTRECRLDRDLNKLKKKYKEIQARATALAATNASIMATNTTLNNNLTNTNDSLNKEIFDREGQVTTLEMNNEQTISSYNSLNVTSLSTPIPNPNYNSYQDIVSENSLLTTKINSLKDLYQTGDQKSYYEGKQNAYLSKLNSALFWFYYILLLLFTYVLFYINISMGNYLKIAILVSAGLYPFIIIHIENVLYTIYKIIIAFLNVNPYTNHY
jgi:hypothetical protein